nr:hypothetical protein [uncultured Cohaesibacter sp.]
MKKSRSSNAAASKPSNFRIAGVFVASLMIAGCSATHSDLDNSALGRSKQAPVASATSNPAAAPATGDGSQKTGLIPPVIPSQLAYSIELLNAEPKDEDYPAIVELSTKDPSLLTPEERKKLEAELIKLGNKAK